MRIASAFVSLLLAAGQMFGQQCGSGAAQTSSVNPLTTVTAEVAAAGWYWTSGSLHRPSITVTGWNGAAPSVIAVGKTTGDGAGKGLAKILHTDYTAVKTDATTLSISAQFDIGPNTPIILCNSLGSSGGLLTGMTPANYSAPSGWTVVATQDFESGILTGGQWGDGTFSTTQQHNDGNPGHNHAYAGQIGSSGIDWNYALPRGTQEVYASFYEYLDPAFAMNDEMFLFHVYQNPDYSSADPLLQETILDWFQNTNGDYNSADAEWIWNTQGHSYVQSYLYANNTLNWIVPTGRWVQWEIDLRFNTVNGSNCGTQPASCTGNHDGSFTIYRDGIPLVQQLGTMELTHGVDYSQNDTVLQLMASYSKVIWRLPLSGNSCTAADTHAPWLGVCSSRIRGCGYEPLPQGWDVNCKSGGLPIDCTAGATPPGPMPCPPVFNRYLDDVIVLTKSSGSSSQPPSPSPPPTPPPPPVPAAGSVPTVGITAPASQATVSGVTKVVAVALDTAGIASVQFTLDGSNLGAPQTIGRRVYFISWDTTTASYGSHTLSAIACDVLGSCATAGEVSVSVNNGAPVVPASTGSGIFPASVTLNVDSGAKYWSIDFPGYAGFKLGDGAGTQSCAQLPTSCQGVMGFWDLKNDPAKQYDYGAFDTGMFEHQWNNILNRDGTGRNGTVENEYKEAGGPDQSLTVIEQNNVRVKIVQRGPLHPYGDRRYAADPNLSMTKTYVFYRHGTGVATGAAKAYTTTTLSYDGLDGQSPLNLQHIYGYTKMAWARISGELVKHEDMGCGILTTFTPTPWQVIYQAPGDYRNKDWMLLSPTTGNSVSSEQILGLNCATPNGPTLGHVYRCNFPTVDGCASTTDLGPIVRTNFLQIEKEATGSYMPLGVYSSSVYFAGGLRYNWSLTGRTLVAGTPQTWQSVGFMGDNGITSEPAANAYAAEYKGVVVGGVAPPRIVTVAFDPLEGYWTLPASLAIAGFTVSGNTLHSPPFNVVGWTGPEPASVSVAGTTKTLDVDYVAVKRDATTLLLQPLFDIGAGATIVFPGH